MQVKLKYGARGITLNYPETENFQGVLYPESVRPIGDAAAELKMSLEQPIASAALAELANGRENAVIVISDITRPVPNKLLLPGILQQLHLAGLAREQITILIATGIHRPNEGNELIQLVGQEIAEKYRIINHFSKNQEDMVLVGEIGEGVPAYVNKHYVDADLKILTGFIEPH
ncbi:MAG: lactate racemase domain-containing protein, partial [Desulfuromusa sp.]|nr:lactate racemase domain-containing protein [Desulfuromusa sp.]